MKTTSQIKILILLLSSLFLISCTQPDKQPFHDLKGHVISLNEFKGKWVIINYWASWCSKCIYEIPELNDFYNHNRDHNVLFFGVNYDQVPEAELTKLVQKAEIEFPIFKEDPAKVLQLGDIDAVPVTFIFNPKGEMVKKILGPNTEQSLQKIMADLKEDFV